jgi:hypothetical protein
MVGLILWGIIVTLGAAALRGILLAAPLMVGLHFLHDYVPMVPQLGFIACFWLLFVVGILFVTTNASLSKS